MSCRIFRVNTSPAVALRCAHSHMQGGRCSTDFDITETESEALYQNGIQAAQHFLKHWNFDKWKRKYRNS